jgi:hypothetical protein
MGLLNMFIPKKDYLDSYLVILEKAVEFHSELDNLNPDDVPFKTELIQYRKFIVKLVAGSLLLLKTKEYLKEKEFEKGNLFYKKILNTVFKHTSPFYNNFVKNDQIIIGTWDNDRLKENIEFYLNMERWLKNFQPEIYKSFNDCESFYYYLPETLQNGEINEEFSYLSNKGYYNFISELFLSKIDNQRNGKPIVRHYDNINIRDSFEFEMSSFISNLLQIYADIEITPQMFD